MLKIGLRKIKQEATAPQIISFHLTLQCEKHKHQKGLRSLQGRTLVTTSHHLPEKQLTLQSTKSPSLKTRKLCTCGLVYHLNLKVLNLSNDEAHGGMTVQIEQLLSQLLSTWICYKCCITFNSWVYVKRSNHLVSENLSNRMNFFFNISFIYLYFQK